MKTISLTVLILGNIIGVFAANLPRSMGVQGASIKRFSLQGDFTSLDRCADGVFYVGGVGLEEHVANCFALNDLRFHKSGPELRLGLLNSMSSLAVIQVQNFNPSLVQYSIHKPLQNVGRDMKSFNDGRYTTFGNAYLVYGLARDLGFIHW